MRTTREMNQPSEQTGRWTSRLNRQGNEPAVRTTRRKSAVGERHKHIRRGTNHEINQGDGPAIRTNRGQTSHQTRQGDGSAIRAAWEGPSIREKDQVIRIAVLQIRIQAKITIRIRIRNHELTSTAASRIPVQGIFQIFILKQRGLP